VKPRPTQIPTFAARAAFSSARYGAGARRSAIAHPCRTRAALMSGPLVPASLQTAMIRSGLSGALGWQWTHWRSMIAHRPNVAFWPQAYFLPAASQNWAVSGASMPKRSISVPAISIVSPSTNRHFPIIGIFQLLCAVWLLDGSRECVG
jgi:hypothetical protein